MMGIRNFFLELRRRRVFRVAGMYIVAGWVGVQVASLIFPAIHVEEEAIRYVWLGFLIAFPPVLVFSWLYDITPDGIIRTPPDHEHTDEHLRLRRLDYLLLVALLGIISVMAIRLSGEILEYESEQAVNTHTIELDKHAIAVLPLEDLSEDDSQGYFVDGMHDSLISVLSGISALKVISRTSARIYRDSDKTIPEIGRELDSANIIEGSVLRHGDSIRVVVKLIDARADQLIWSNVYEEDLSDVLRLQSKLARSIAAEIEVALTAEESDYLDLADRVTPEAFEYYLKGRFHWYQFTAQDLSIAQDYFKKAIELDPGYALAYVGYADALATVPHLGLAPASEVFPQAAQLVEQALELDPLLAEAHDLKARIQFVWNQDWLAADRGFREAIRLKPGYPDVHIVYSQFLGIQNRFSESLSEVRAGLALDPLNHWFRTELGVRLGWMGEYDKAIDELTLITKNHPNWPTAYRHLWELRYFRGENRHALDAAIRYYQLTGEPELATIAAGFDAQTEFSAAMLAIAAAMIKNAEETYVSDLELARIFAFAGDVTRTLDRLEMAYQKRDTQLVYSAANPLFSLVWHERRYNELRTKMNLPAAIAESQ